MSQTFSQYFKLDKNQLELDFVDIIIDGRDNAFFIDPFVIGNIKDDWSILANNKINIFFQKVIHYIKTGETDKAKMMLNGFHEPKETRLGYSANHKNGKSVSGEKSAKIFEALSNSKVIKSDLIRHIEETQLMIKGIGDDNISDVVTMIIKSLLVEYTKTQCYLHNVKINSVAGGQFWDDQNEVWNDEYVDLPVVNNKPILLVPKKIAKFTLSLVPQEYHDFYSLVYLQKKYADPRLGIAKILGNGNIKVYKKDIKEKVLNNSPLKENNYTVTAEEGRLLEDYRKDKQNNINKSSNAKLQDPFNTLDPKNIDKLIEELKKVPTGTKSATQYHNHMIGILEALFYPNLTHFTKEEEIHEGRKRIDIAASNSAKDGFFYTLPNTKQVPSAYIFFECKNYSSDIANPELDQMSGRFSFNRGKIGFILCRNFHNKELFWDRCKDTAKDGRGFIIVLDDDDIIELLEIKKNKDNKKLNQKLDSYYKKLVF